MRDTTELEQNWKGILSDADRRARDATTLKRIAATLSRAEGYESLKKVQQALEKLDGLEGLPAEDLAAARLAAEPVADWLESEWARRASDFVAELRAYFAERAVRLEGEGFILASPPLSFEIDPSADRADLTYAGETVKQRLPLVAERLLRERESGLQRLERGSTPPDLLADQLVEAYDAVTRMKEARPGARVRLADAHFQLFVDRQTVQARQSLTRGKLKEYPRVQFAFDLAGLLAAPHFLHRGGRTIHLIEASPSLARSRSASIAVVARDGATTTLADLRVD